MVGVSFVSVTRIFGHVIQDFTLVDKSAEKRHIIVMREWFFFPSLSSLLISTSSTEKKKTGLPLYFFFFEISQFNAFTKILKLLELKQQRNRSVRKRSSKPMKIT